MFKVITAAALLAAATSVFAQADIVESQPVTDQNSKTKTANKKAAQPSEDPQGLLNQMYFQLQTLQQEVLQLRGLVEEQSNELKQLKQQRMEDYLDLDRRVSELSKSGAAPARPSASATPSGTSTPIATDAISATPAKDELASYRSAIDLVLKQRDFDGGAAALQAYLQDFPKGHYVANAQYWLGQIYFQKGDMAQSQIWFADMIAQHPQHHKTAEAKYKLAKILQAKGEIEKAKALLSEVAESNSSVATMAKELLNSL